MLAAYVLKAGQVPEIEKFVTSELQLELTPEESSPAEYYSAQRELEIQLAEKLQTQEGQKIYEEFELPLVPVLTHMELNGIGLNPEELNQQSQGSRHLCRN